jgi:NADH-quinone oxidoreductase subunit E
VGRFLSKRSAALSKLTVLFGSSGSKSAARLAEALVEEGFAAVTLPSGGEILEFLAHGRADAAVLLDDLPDTDSLDLLDRLRAATPELPVIVLSADPTVSGAVEAMSRGAHHYAATSLGPEEFSGAIGSALKHKIELLKESERKTLHRLVSFDDLSSIDTIDSVMERHGFRKSRLVGILQDIQRELRYLPQEALHHVAERLNLPLPRVYGVATFYKSFSLRPRGRHTISVCMGTACHVQGGVGILEKLERELGIHPGDMTYDERFSLECVRCVGCCGLAPVFVVDDDFHGKMTQDKVAGVIEGYE